MAFARNAWRQLISALLSLLCVQAQCCLRPIRVFWYYVFRSARTEANSGYNIPTVHFPHHAVIFMHTEERLCSAAQTNAAIHI